VQLENSDARGEAMQLAIVHRRMIEAHAYSITRDFYLADDIYQEVATVLITHWREVPPKDRVLPWLKEVTRRKALELQRKQSRSKAMLSNEAMEKSRRLFPSKRTTASIRNTFLQIKVAIQFNGHTYAQTVTVTYTSRAHVSGKFKKQARAKYAFKIIAYFDGQKNISRFLVRKKIARVPSLE